MSLGNAKRSRKSGMRQGPKARAITLVAIDEFEIARGVIVPAGQYDGWERKSTFSTMQSRKLANATYELEFSAEQLGGMDAMIARGIIKLTYDVTQLVDELVLTVN